MMRQNQTENIVKALQQNKLASTIFTPSSVNSIIDGVHGYRPLHLAAIYSTTKETFLYLLRHGALTTTQDRSGDTPISLAMRHGNYRLWEAIEHLRKEDEDHAKFVGVKVEEYRNENANLKADVENLQRENDELRTKVVNTKNSYDFAVSSLERLNTKYDELLMEHRTLQNSVGTLRTENNKLKSDITRLQAKNSDLQDSFENVTNSLRKKRKLGDR